MPHQNVNSPKVTAQTATAVADEVADYMDDGVALTADDVQQGGTHRNRPDRTDLMHAQGRKTVEGNRQRLRTGSADPA